MSDHRSHQLLSLARNLDLLGRSQRPQPVPDEAFEAFRDQYVEWACERDHALERHLSDSTGHFRVHVPFSERAFPLALQVAWYLDEIVLRDPIEQSIEFAEGQFEQAKQRTCQVLRVLERFEALLEDGLVLLAGSTVVPRQGLEPKPIVHDLAADQGLMEVVKRAATVGRFEVRDSDGKPTSFYNVELDSGFVSFGSPTLGPKASVFIPIHDRAGTLPISS